MRSPLNCEVEKMSWKNAPPEVQEYFKNGARTPVDVHAVEPFVVSVTFDNGVTIEQPMTAYGGHFYSRQYHKSERDSLWSISNLSYPHSRFSNLGSLFDQPILSAHLMLLSLSSEEPFFISLRNSQNE